MDELGDHSYKDDGNKCTSTSQSGDSSEYVSADSSPDGPHLDRSPDTPRLDRSPDAPPLDGSPTDFRICSLYNPPYVNNLPKSVTVLTTPNGGVAFIIGTAHFSLGSQDDVRKVIRAVCPDVVCVELCNSRNYLMTATEDIVIEESKDLTASKIRLYMRDMGAIQGLLHALLIIISTNITKQLGTAPGGEFRAAYQEAKYFPNCRVILIDRSIKVTLKRAINALSTWQILKLFVTLIFSKEKVTAEDVERCKDKDILEEMMEELTGDYPSLSHVFVDERDLYLAKNIRTAASQRKAYSDTGSVVVAVVGIGHCVGIKRNWDKVMDMDLSYLLVVPERSVGQRVWTLTIHVATVTLVSWLGYKLVRTYTK